MQKRPRNRQKLFDPIKAKRCGLVQQQRETQSLKSGNAFFKKKRTVKNDAPANQMLLVCLFV